MKQIDEILKEEMKELIKDYVFKFDDEDSILIKKWLGKLESKKYSDKEKNNIMSKIIYLLKKNDAINKT